MKIVIQKQVGTFAENKEGAKKIRTRTLLPALRRGQEVDLDFKGVTLATQSFVHALVAEAIRDPECDALERISFSNCSENVRSIIEVVVSYCQDEWGEAPEELGNGNGNAHDQAARPS